MKEPLPEYIIKYVTRTWWDKLSPEDRADLSTRTRMPVRKQKRGKLPI